MSNTVKAILISGLVIAAVASVVFLSSDAEESEPISPLLPLSTPIESSADLDDLIDRAGERRFVLLGESSHGTSEYYELRREISQRLIADKEFSFIAVEGDWPYIFHVNRYVKGYPNAPDDAEEALLGAGRWPGWMWANEEFLELVNWLRSYNDKLPPEQRVGLYGIDMQDMSSSIDSVLGGLEEKNTELEYVFSEHRKKPPAAGGRNP